MSKKREFPSDWSNMTDDQVLENVTYLLANYKKYKVVSGDFNKKIGNVNIHAHVDKSVPGWMTYWNINGKCIRDDTELGKVVGFLFQEVCHYKRPVNKKLNNFWRGNRNIIASSVATGLMIVGICVFVGIKLGNRCKRKQEQFKQEIIKEALEQFRQEQQKDTILYQPQKRK